LAADHLLREGVDAARVIVTGNPGIDAVLYACNTVERGAEVRSWPELDTSKKVLLVTAHRRESFGSGFQEICRGLARLAGRSDVQIVFPVHRNPQVREPVYRMLGKVANVSLLEPLGYLEFVDLMRRAYLLLTDSGGIQEEAPSLGKPVLVLRDKTERPEAVEAGTVRLVGASAERIVGESVRLLEDGCEYARMSRIHNPYGDGRASERIAEAMESYFSSLP
jgi:UDP-N-acetylglucosamine 2-epimerase (non-hydrolysing)